MADTTAGTSGQADPFTRPASWDADLAADWAGRLNQRAARAGQADVRRRMCELAGIGPGDTVVELGCGTGHLLAELAALVGPDGHVLGVEPQPEFAREARDRTAPLGCVTVHTGGASSVPLPDGAAGAILAQTVLLHLPAPELDAVIARACRMLKPGGRFVSADQDAETRVIDHPDRDTTRRIVRYSVDEQFADGWLARRLPRLLRAAGFTGVTTEIHPDLDTEGTTLAAEGRRAQAARDGGAITARDCDRWLAQLRDQAARGDYFASIDYYLTAATR